MQQDDPDTRLQSPSPKRTHLTRWVRVADNHKVSVEITFMRGQAMSCVRCFVHESRSGHLHRSAHVFQWMVPAGCCALLFAVMFRHFDALADLRCSLFDGSPPWRQQLTSLNKTKPQNTDPWFGRRPPAWRHATPQPRGITASTAHSSG